MEEDKEISDEVKAIELHEKLINDKKEYIRKQQTTVSCSDCRYQANNYLSGPHSYQSNYCYYPEYNKPFGHQANPNGKCKAYEEVVVKKEDTFNIFGIIFWIIIPLLTLCLIVLDYLGFLKAYYE